MDYEILDEGDEGDEGDGTLPPPRRPGGILIGALIALGALAVVLLRFGGGDWSASPAASVTPAPSPTADPYRNWVISDGDSNQQDRPPRTELSFGPTCPPVLHGTERLTISFQVINSGATPLRLLVAEPQLPLPGYLKLVKTRAGGACRRPGDEKASRRLLASGESLLVTWTFRVLKHCPRPAPVGARVRVDFVTGPVALTYPLLADLGSVPFTDC